MSVLPYPDVHQRVSIQDRVPVELPGTIFKHKQTGELIGVLSCDEGQWCELVSLSAARYSLHLTDILKSYSKASKANLTITSRIEKDCSHELLVERQTYRVSALELVKAMQGAVR